MPNIIGRDYSGMVRPLGRDDAAPKRVYHKAHLVMEPLINRF